MSRNRLFPYNDSTEHVSLAKAKTQTICDHFNVEWTQKFRQKDILDRYKPFFSLAAQYENGLCQIFSIMYMHIRDAMMASPELTNEFYRLWYTRDKIEAEIFLTHLPVTGNTDRLLYEYFDDNGSKSLVGMTDILWKGVSGRIQSAINTRRVEEVHVFFRSSSSQMVFAESMRGDIDSTIDSDFMHECYPEYLLANNEVVMYLRDYHEMAEMITRKINELLKHHNPLRCLLQLYNASNNHIDSKHMMTLLKLSDSKCLEFIDANRGVFLIPYDDSKKVTEFFHQYFTDIYQHVGFNSVHFENYMKVTSPLELRQDQLHRLESLRMREEARQQLKWHAKL